MDRPDDPFVKDFPGVVHALGPANLSYGFSPAYVPWLSAQSANYDVVIVNGLWQYCGLGTRLALASSDKPYLLFTHGMLDPWFEQAFPLKHIKKSIYWLMAESIVVRNAAAVLFTSEEERLNARRSFRPYKCIEIVSGCGTSASDVDADAQREIFLNKYPALREKELLLFLGRIHPKKGCDLLLKAFSEIVSSNQDLHLVIAGPEDGQYGDKIRQSHGFDGAIDGRVTWTGMLQGDLKWGALNAIDALILPSHQENFAVAVAEALACSKPVLISNKVNIWRDIAYDEAGLVEPDTLEGTERLLRHWLSLSREERMAMAFKAKQCFLKRYDIQKTYKKLMSILENAIAKKTPAER